MSNEILTREGLLANLADLPLDLRVVSASDKITEFPDSATQVGRVCLAGFDEQELEVVSATLDIKVDAASCGNALDEESVFIINASDQGSRVLMPALVHGNIARIVCARPTPAKVINPIIRRKIRPSLQ